jgi:negative modulator of initiation of replication
VKLLQNSGKPPLFGRIRFVYTGEVKNIVVDDEIYAHLVRHTREIGESASSILRRLLGLKNGNSKTSGQVEQVFDFLKQPEFYQHMNNSQRFLFILSWAYRRHPAEFENVVSIEGNRRK